MFLRNRNRCFIIAEISANHGKSFNRAVQMIKIAKKCRVDAVKFQCYTPDTITINVNNKYFRVNHPTWGGQTLYQLYKKSYTPWKWLEKLKTIADDLGLVFFATAFDKTSVDFLEGLKVPVFKIASFELVDLPLIEYTAKKKKPMILSTGMATLSEIRSALNVARRAGAEDISLLKCVSDYPASYESMNLKTISDMIKRFKLPIGLSDHTLGIATSIAGVCLGASIIEKHFTLSRKIETPDSFFSIEPEELKELVKSIRLTEKALGVVYYGPTEREKKNRVFRRSLFTVKDMKAGEIFTEENIKSIRPGYGLHTRFLKDIIGKQASKNTLAGTPMQWNLVERKGDR